MHQKVKRTCPTGTNRATAFSKCKPHEGKSTSMGSSCVSSSDAPGYRPLFNGANISWWVKSRPQTANFRRPLFPQQRTFIPTKFRSALCQKRTHETQQFAASFDHLVDASA